eukprot:5263799-Amphidinium_carterae.1
MARAALYEGTYHGQEFSTKSRLPAAGQPDTLTNVGHIANTASPEVGVATVPSGPVGRDGVDILPQNRGRFVCGQRHQRRRHSK